MKWVHGACTACGHSKDRRCDEETSSGRRSLTRQQHTPLRELNLLAPGAPVGAACLRVSFQYLGTGCWNIPIPFLAIDPPPTKIKCYLIEVAEVAVALERPS